MAIIKRLSSLMVLISLLSSIFITGLFAKEKKVLLKVSSAFNTNLMTIGGTLPTFAKNVMSMTDTIKIKIYEPNKLVPPFEILEAVSKGRVQVGYSTAGYWKGKIPAAPLFSAIPFGPEAPEFIAWLYYGNGLKLYQEMYDSHGYDVKVIPVGILPPETSGWFKKEIKSVKDLKGLKMRFFGFGGDVMQKLGVSTTLLPVSEIFPALEKGVIDATEFSVPIIDAKLGFYKIAKYNYFPGWHQQATLAELLINKKVWNKMSKQQQNIIEVSAKASILISLAEGEASQFGPMIKNFEERGVITKRWSPKMLATFEEKWTEVVIEQSKNKFFKKVWRDLIEFREGYAVWKAKAFLQAR